MSHVGETRARFEKWRLGREISQCGGQYSSTVGGAHVCVVEICIGGRGQCRSEEG